MMHQFDVDMLKFLDLGIQEAFNDEDALFIVKMELMGLEDMTLVGP